MKFGSDTDKVKRQSDIKYPKMFSSVITANLKNTTTDIKSLKRVMQNSLQIELTRYMPDKRVTWMLSDSESSKIALDANLLKNIFTNLNILHDVFNVENKIEKEMSTTEGVLTEKKKETLAVEGATARVVANNPKESFGSRFKSFFNLKSKTVKASAPYEASNSSGAKDLSDLVTPSVAKNQEASIVKQKAQGTSHSPPGTRHSPHKGQRK
ncbi:hypothetical protein OAC51_08800 [Flavobacteriaceae bacterium]|nr:hypothetical protein [Flavobacteriaceae bacterium]